MKLKVDQRKLNKDLRQAGAKFLLGLQREIVREVPPRFRNRINVNTQDLSIEVNDETFKFWELDTRPHIIRPKTKKALSFEWQNHPADMSPGENGKFQFKKVNHPGTQGHHVLENKANDRQLVESLLEDAIK